MSIAKGTIKAGSNNQEWFVVDNINQQSYQLIQEDVDQWFNKATCCYQLTEGLVIEYTVIDDTHAHLI
jgi:hypothetical protein